jgi:hypothetical protein
LRGKPKPRLLGLDDYKLEGSTVYDKAGRAWGAGARTRGQEKAK